MKMVIDGHEEFLNEYAIDNISLKARKLTLSSGRFGVL